MSEELKEPAPGNLAVVEAFVNTTAFLYGREELVHPAVLRDWLVGYHLLDDAAHVGHDDLRRALEVREALRALLRANSGLALDAQAVATLNEAIGAARLRVGLDSAGQAQIAPHAGGVAGALGRILVYVVAAMADGTWAQLKACGNEECRWAFFDRAKNHSGRWCTMSVCGNRSKTSAYRRRHAGHATEHRST